MRRYISRRLVHLVFILVGVSALAFSMLRLIPGDPAHLLLGEFASPAEVAGIRDALGLDASYPHQYLIFVKNLLHGDMGTSIRTRTPVLEEILTRFLATLELSVAAMLISSVIGLLAGIVSAVKRQSVFDYIAMVMALAGISMPIFWLGLMLIYLFSVKWALLPMMGRMAMGVDQPVITGLVMVDSLLQGRLKCENRDLTWRTLSKGSQLLPGVVIFRPCPSMQDSRW